MVNQIRSVIGWNIFFKINGMFLPSQRIVTALFLVSSIPEEGSKPHINPPLYISQNVNLTQWFYKRGKNCETFIDEGTDRRRNRHIYRGMECRWSEKFTWTFGLHNTWGNRSFPNQFWKGQTTFFALQINATIHTIQVFACYFLNIDYINVNLAL